MTLRDAAVLTAHFLDGMPVDAAELKALSLQGSTVARLIDGVSPREAETLYFTLPQDFRDGLADISPSNHIKGLRARLLVMHDRYDRHVPVAESRRLVEAVGDRDDVRYTEFLSFNHTIPGEGGPARPHRAGVSSLTPHVRSHPHRPLTRAVAGQRRQDATGGHFYYWGFIRRILELLHFSIEQYSGKEKCL